MAGFSRGIQSGNDFNHPCNRTLTEADMAFSKTMTHNLRRSHLDAEYMRGRNSDRGSSTAV